MQNPRVSRMMHKERHMRDGKVMLNLLKYDVMWVVQHWGYLGKENACDFFRYIVSLFNEELGKKSKSSKKDTLPDVTGTSVAKDVGEKSAGIKEKEI